MAGKVVMSFSQPSARLRPFEPIQFGRYTLVHQLSTGGMGEIYLARMSGAQGFEKLCIIKKILPELAADPDFVQRFVNEAKTLVKLSHGSIAQVLDMGLHEGDPYIALEFVDGKDLRKVITRMREREKPLPLTFSLYVMSRVLDALAYAHRKRDEQDREINLVHRDVSPPNILISYEGEVKLIDFGLAKSALNSSRTNPSIVLGKFLYMSPEQARHQRVDRRSDLYSAGICLYELISGHNPYESIPTGDLMSMVASPSLPALEIVAPECPGRISDVVMRALSVEPDERYASAEEFRGKVVAALMELDPSAGAETVSRIMRETFAQELGNERRVLSSLQEGGPVADAQVAAASSPTPTAVPAMPLLTPQKPPSLSLPSRAAPIAPPLPGPPAPKIETVPLSFAPTPRTHADSQGPESFPEATVPQYAGSIPQTTMPQFHAPPVSAVPVSTTPQFPWPVRAEVTDPDVVQKVSSKAAHGEIPAFNPAPRAPVTDPELLEVTDPRAMMDFPPAPARAQGSEQGASGAGAVVNDGPTVVRPMPMAPPPPRGGVKAGAASSRRFPELARLDEEDDAASLAVTASPPPVARDTHEQVRLSPPRELAEEHRPTPRMAASASSVRASESTAAEKGAVDDAFGDELVTASGVGSRKVWIAVAAGVVVVLLGGLYLARGPLGLEGLTPGVEATHPAIAPTPIARPEPMSPVTPVPPPVKKLEPLTPPVAAKGPKKGLSLDDTDLVLPLTPGKKTPAVAKRRPPPAPAKNAVMLREWARTRVVFKRLENTAFCETDGAGPVCEQFHTLEGEVAAAGSTPDEELIVKVRDFRKLLEKRGAP